MQIAAYHSIDVQCYTISDTPPCAGRDPRTLAHANSPPRAACRTFERVGAVAALPLPNCGFSESGSSHPVGCAQVGR
ncbi:hypothetical protein CY34DRAFT_805113 [Suillus luteus UH-Slu-Lm8-n1]|uniref:Uncharacterized protein n=1 Tax=Suillus luteus UH-Slu-Lm8-n1 TaxID=930992 RepID=A0A0D0B744_9AGAM|nr:hypothetical protein CY34DRAFT_805113 [Suillus luteus UH-Slu-Lm8-n1]